MIKELVLIFISAAFINNFVLVYFLGVCPFLRTSCSLKNVSSMGFAVTLSMVLTAAVTWPVYTYLLKKYSLQYLEYVIFLALIYAVIEIMETISFRLSSRLYEEFGIYFSLLKSNCIVLGVSLFMIIKAYGYIQSLVFALGGGIGFSMILVIMSGIREELELADVPKSLKGAGIIFITAGCFALAFMGFSALPSR